MNSQSLNTAVPSSSRMHFMSHNWSATKQRLHPQSVAEISRHSVLSGQDSTMWDIVWVSPQGHRSVSVSRHFLLQAPQCPFCTKTVQQRPLLPREVETRLPACRWELTTWADFQLCLHRLSMSTGCKSSHNGSTWCLPNSSSSSCRLEVYDIVIDYSVYML